MATVAAQRVTVASLGVGIATCPTKQALLNEAGPSHPSTRVSQ
eukprot:COSAG01_NODE_58195_length_307_cov_1.245192_1_plen_42_part_01